MTPLVWAGNGIRLAGEAKRFREFIDSTQLPFVTTWTAADLIPSDHRMNMGIVGMCGHPGANKAVASCDHLIVLGSHLSTCQTGPHFDYSKVEIWDIDQHELDRIDGAKKHCAPLKEFFDQEHDYLCLDNPYKREGVPMIGSYGFNNGMTSLLPPGTCIVIDGGGTALYTGFQSSHIKEGTRLICSSSMSAMGSGLPEAIGACFANDRKLTTCLIGDGSLMLNVQELQTIATHCLPIKVFVINNGGYLAIRQTQKEFQEGRYYGVGGNDLEFTSVEKLAIAFGIKYYSNADRDWPDCLQFPGPTLCEVFCPHDQPMMRGAVGKPLTEMVLA